MEMRKSEKVKREKAKDVKPIVEECIRQGLDFSETRKELKKRNINYPNLAKIFNTWKQEIFPEDARTEAISSLKDKRKAKDEKGILDVLSPRAWSKQKQKEADESPLAEVLNEAVFQLVPCPNKGLKIEDVKQINVGGSVIGLIIFYTNINLNHPILIFTLRTIMLVVKIRAKCYEIQEKMGNIKGKIEDLRKGEWSPPEPER
jgi:hypothetical protein